MISDGFNRNPAVHGGSINKKIAVVVTTKDRGVFFGYISKEETANQDVLRMTDTAMVTYWSADLKNVLGLAAIGPTPGCKVGYEVPAITLHDITSVMEVSPEAEAAFNAGRAANGYSLIGND